MRIRKDLSSDFFECGFTEQTDPFGRGDLARRLTGLFKELQQGTVSIIDGRWGSGKTVFAKQWQHHLKTNGVPCIYIDAFAMDYVESPFRAIASAFIIAAKESGKKDDGRFKGFVNSVAKAAKVVAAPATKMAIKAVSLGVIGSAEIEGVKSAAEALADGFADVSEEAVKKILEDHSNDQIVFSEMRKSLASLPGLFSSGLSVQSDPQVDSSLVVIIDELDRCRPDFALGVIETLKHFFHADRVHFVLVTNVRHLALSVQGKYGAGDASEEYLQKFYDFIIPFTDSGIHSQLTDAGRHARSLMRELLDGIETRDGDDLAGNVAHIITAYDLSLRQAEKIVATVLLSKIDFAAKAFQPGILVAFMAALKILNPIVFSDIKRRTLNFDSLSSFISQGVWPDRFPVNELRTMIRYHTDPSISREDPEYENYAGWFFRFSFASRLDVLPYLANSVVDRFS